MRHRILFVQYARQPFPFAFCTRVYRTETLTTVPPDTWVELHDDDIIQMGSSQTFKYRVMIPLSPILIPVIVPASKPHLLLSRARASLASLDSGVKSSSILRRHSSVRFLALIKGYTCLGSSPVRLVFSEYVLNLSLDSMKVLMKFSESRRYLMTPSVYTLSCPTLLSENSKSLKDTACNNLEHDLVSKSTSFLDICSTDTVAKKVC